MIEELTPQELQIARRAADGASNRDIAEWLSCCPARVDTRTQLAGLDW